MRVASCLIAFALVAPALQAGECAKTTDPAAVVQAQLKAYNRHDIEAFAVCYSEKLVITDLAGQRPAINDIASLKKTYGFLAHVPKEFGVDILKRTVSGPIVVDLEHVRNTPKDMPPLPDAIVVYEVRDGKILHVWFPPGK